MDNKEKLSIVLPCYKVEPFLDSIYKEIKAQTFQEEIEYIFVDDGGGESQAKKLEALATIDTYVRVVHKKNGGLASARNAGIDAASGDWIVFVDPDDHLKPNHLQILYNAVSNEDNNIDVGIGGYSQISEEDGRKAELFYDMGLLEGQSVVDAATAYRKCPELIFVSAWSKIYRRSFLIENNFRFDEHLKFNEDVIFNAAVWRKARNVSFVRDSGYIYIKYYSRGICSTYNSGLKNDNIQRINLLLDLQKDLGYKDEENRRFKTSQLWILAYMLACNPFKAKTPLSFTEGVRKVKEEIFEDKEIIEAWKCHDRSSDNRILRLFDHLISLRNPWLMGLVFKSIFLLKDNMRGVFSKLKNVAQK